MHFQQLLIVSKCWMRSLGGCDLWLTLDLDLDNRRVLTINPSLHAFGVHFPACGFRGGSHCPGCSLESLRRWNHLDGLQEWTRASSIWTLRVQGVFVDICSLYSRPNQDSGVSPCYLKPPLANMGCSASFVQPHPPCNMGCPAFFVPPSPPYVLV